jgi:hypothetical protein
MSIKNNTISLQEILESINTLPDAGGVELPELTEEGTASDLLAGKQLIDQEGNIVEGVFSIDDELTAQDNLIAQIQAAADSLPEASEPTLQSKTVTPTTSSQTVTADSGYDGLSEVTINAMPAATQATPSIIVNSSGLITASTTQTAGYVSAGTKSATKQLATQTAQTITPSTTDQTIASGRYLTGAQTIKGDANLVASNIKNGVSIFGVSGTLQESNGNGESTDSEYYASGIIELSDQAQEITIPVSGQIGGLSLTYLSSSISTYVVIPSWDAYIYSLYVGNDYKGYITDTNSLRTDFTYDVESGVISISELYDYFKSGIYVYVVW